MARPRHLVLTLCGISAALVSLLAPASSSAQSQEGNAASSRSATLDAVRARRLVLCGVSGESPGFSLPDSRGEMRGLDADTCRAVAASVLGDAKLVRFVPLSPQARFTALQSGEVDLLVRNTSWTLTREASLGLTMAWINFHDGTAFVVKGDAGVTSAKGLDGATVCLLQGTTTELDVAAYFRANGLSFTPVLFGGVTETGAAFLAGRCDAWANDASYLGAFRATQPDKGLVILPERISSEPVGAMVRKGDDSWFDLVRWTGAALVAAEEAGVTSANAAEQRRTTADPSVQRLLGTQGDLGTALGVDSAWAFNIISQVGNYGEMWERNLAPLGIERGANRLASRGGLMYAPPMR
ncbi:amino acid ABC transporter substrate-binding protein [Roseomonas nepalensis]|uniref:Amino acid ABC transporter substrate-binding protein n=1 Tax=Muricoccus nepalensis TaxID=1854500 RepID=A0A502FXF9_9PROT|nr:amino acid ABC transporter substrate-binding protein [Roseomonas nepalensis]TPG53633.1 amino acid ABC transporter substrate-binding protein [Roseomonas nepalensis]